MRVGKVGMRAVDVGGTTANVGGGTVAVGGTGVAVARTGAEDVGTGIGVADGRTGVWIVEGVGAPGATGRAVPAAGAGVV
jgi:hypothetical protein